MGKTVPVLESCYPDFTNGQKWRGRGAVGAHDRKRDIARLEPAGKRFRCVGLIYTVVTRFLSRGVWSRPL